MTEYVSWKTGDPAIKPKPQTIQPKTWTTLSFDAGDCIVPHGNGTAHWAFYANADVTGGAKVLKARFCRDPKGIKDFTGHWSTALGVDSILCGAWFFNAKKGQPVGVQVWHDGTKPLTITTRELKMWIP